MLKIRTIKTGELDQFCSACKTKRHREIKETLEMLFEKEESSVDLCFVAEEDGKFIARTAYFTPSGDPKDLSMFAFSIPWDDDNYLEIGKKLLKESLKALKKQGVILVEQRLDNDFKNLEKAKKLFTEMGIPIIQEKFAFVFKGKTPDIPIRLQFKNIEETGEGAFIEAVKEVTKNTLDEQDLISIKKLGAQKAAENYFNCLKHINFIPSMWLLAYDDEKEFAGLLIFQKFTDELGAINYIGVSPDQRGKGYVYDLIAKGNELAKEYGIKKILADIDVRNFPLEKALTKAGYKKETSFLVFSGYLEDILI